MFRGFTHIAATLVVTMALPAFGTCRKGVIALVDSGKPFQARTDFRQGGLPDSFVLVGGKLMEWRDAAPLGRPKDEPMSVAAEVLIELPDGTKLGPLKAMDVASINTRVKALAAVGENGKLYFLRFSNERAGNGDWESDKSQYPRTREELIESTGASLEALEVPLASKTGETPESAQIVWGRNRERNTFPILWIKTAQGNLYRVPVQSPFDNQKLMIRHRFQQHTKKVTHFRAVGADQVLFLDSAGYLKLARRNLPDQTITTLPPGKVAAFTASSVNNGTHKRIRVWVAMERDGKTQLYELTHSPVARFELTEFQPDAKERIVDLSAAATKPEEAGFARPYLREAFSQKGEDRGEEILDRLIVGVQHEDGTLRMRGLRENKLTVIPWHVEDKPPPPPRQSDVEKIREEKKAAIRAQYTIPNPLQPVNIVRKKPRHLNLEVLAEKIEAKFLKDLDDPEYVPKPVVMARAAVTRAHFHEQMKAGGMYATTFRNDKLHPQERLMVLEVFAGEDAKPGKFPDLTGREAELKTLIEVLQMPTLLAREHYGMQFSQEGKPLFYQYGFTHPFAKDPENYLRRKMAVEALMDNAARTCGLTPSQLYTLVSQPFKTAPSTETFGEFLLLMLHDLDPSRRAVSFDELEFLEAIP